jgi:hypothetical protein
MQRIFIPCCKTAEILVSLLIIPLGTEEMSINSTTTGTNFLILVETEYITSISSQLQVGLVLTVDVQ